MNEEFRNQFPILKKIIYLDSAALVQKPLSVIKANEEYYSNFSVNSHSSDSLLGIKALKNIEDTREKVANLINGNSNEIIITSGTTQSLNMVALMLKRLLKENDEIILSTFNHSSNMVPWIEIAKEVNAKIIFSEESENDSIINRITKKTKLIAISQVNNALLKKKNLKSLYEICKDKNIILINDAAQAVISEKIDLKNESDVVVFSSNKMFGPTGIGVLAVKKELLVKLKPAYYGGGSTVSMNGEKWESSKSIKAFEAGTPNLAGIYQFSKAIDFVQKYVLNDESKKYLLNLSIYLHQQLKLLKDIEIISQDSDFIAIFRLKKYPSQDVVSYLGHNNIYVRAGDFCVKNLKFLKENNGYIRVSLTYYNNKNDIDNLIEKIQKEAFYEFL
ncbi:cysteine desulfurase [[Mycoplasma] mobile]|uniref:Aminotransferase protein S homolog n=1 Tax=Mycoplasma mobile (strain ATCC 43663 / 163K / NCTC 11711) TaxID=267748 RepID=Q6KIL1_MYCM1|nr:aminotransferase class V-fold PLP-dependent enzyme [[Mycoplasma] mobile]AAT27565.1 aminotransferase protein S homolog [Mycoplasma mobile 163K]